VVVKVKRNIPNKIHIIGSVGSGKTTLARNLSSKLNIPFYELDNVVWRRFKSGDKRRTDDERNEILNTIVQTDAWIVEGVHHEWVSQSFQNAEWIIFLDTDFFKRKYRITKRFILQKIGLEHANYKPSFKMFKKMFQWNVYFENESKPEILKILSQYNEKVIILRDNVEIETHL